MYHSDDLRQAQRRCNCCWALLIGILLPLAMIYVLALLKGRQGLMLAALLIGFSVSVFIGDLKLLPALRYLRFLREMESGLRRSADCVLMKVETEAQMQDGAQVFVLHVCMTESGDNRIFYVNASKIAQLPEIGAHVKITSYGRHVVDCLKLK